jgi:hypothetical protein
MARHFVTPLDHREEHRLLRRRQTYNDALDKLGARLQSYCQERGRAVLTGMPSALASSRIESPA